MSVSQEEMIEQWNRFEKIKESNPPIIVEQCLKQNYCYWHALIHDEKENRIFLETSTCGINCVSGFERFQITKPFHDDDWKLAWRVPFRANMRFSNKLVLELDCDWNYDGKAKDFEKEYNEIIMKLTAWRSLTGRWNFGYPGEGVEQFKALFAVAHERFYSIRRSKNQWYCGWDKLKEEIKNEWRAEKWAEENAAWERHRRQIKLRFDRRRKLNIQPMQIMAAAKSLTNYATHQD